MVDDDEYLGVARLTVLTVTDFFIGKVPVGGGLDDLCTVLNFVA